MSAPSPALHQLQRLRGLQVEQLRQQLNYQRGLCQRYRNNINGLERLLGYRVAATTHLQRDNQHSYKLTLYKMLDLQKRELAVAETSLSRVETELLGAARNEKILAVFIAQKLADWQRELGQQEQKIQDGLAAQSAWRNQLAGAQQAH